MIINGPLSESRMRRSQRFYALYNFFNGLSYMCLGETIIILLAVKLNCPDYVVSTLGALVYFSFILLPTGKLLAARIGAASSQAVFWALRNTAALIVASSAIWHYYGNTSGAIATLLTGAFLFYGCRAAGVVMIQPLIGNITTDSNRASILASTAALFYIASFIALIGICFVLRYSEKLSVLTGVIVTGSLFGYTSAFLLKCIDESSSLRESARQPLWPSWRKAIHNQTLMRQIYSSLVINLAVILTVPVSMLTVKRLWHFRPQRIALSLAQLAGPFCCRSSPRIANVMLPQGTDGSIFSLYINGGSMGHQPGLCLNCVSGAVIFHPWRRSCRTKQLCNPLLFAEHSGQAAGQRLDSNLRLFWRDWRPDWAGHLGRAAATGSQIKRFAAGHLPLSALLCVGNHYLDTGFLGSQTPHSAAYRQTAGADHLA